MLQGGLKDTELDYLVYSLVKQVVARSGLSSEIEDVCLGNVGFV